MSRSGRGPAARSSARAARSCRAVAARQEEVLVHHLVHERVGEPVPAALAARRGRLDQVRLDQLVEAALDVGRVGRHLAQQRLVELRADNRGLLEQAPGVAGEPVDPGEQQALQRGRHVHHLALRRARPARALAQEHPLAHEGADDLLDEERVAARPGWPRSPRAGPGIAAEGPEQAAHQRPALHRREGAETEDRLIGPGDRERGGVGAVGQQEHQRPARKVIGHVAQQVERGGVGPVEVLHHDQQRILARRAARPGCARPGRSGAAAAPAPRRRAAPPRPRARSSAPVRSRPPPRPSRRGRGDRRPASAGRPPASPPGPPRRPRGTARRTPRRSARRATSTRPGAPPCRAAGPRPPGGPAAPR